MNILGSSCTQGFGSPVVRRHNPDKDDLENYVKLLRSAHSLSDVIKKGEMLSRDGKNILHLIAAERNFALYEDVLKKCCEDPKCITLLTQAPETRETPLHVLCKYGNLPMLSFLISIPDDSYSASEMHPKYWLKEMGRIPLNLTQDNAFHCLCHLGEFSDGRAQFEDHANRTKMFTMLVELFGKEDATKLASEKNSRGQTLLDLSKVCENTALCEKVTELFATNWRDLHLEQASFTP